MSIVTQTGAGRAALRRKLDGVLLLDKPSGITSHTAMQSARRLLNAAKAGHTGTLDPLATGLLPVCLGEATKFAHLLLEADKTYFATIRLGMTTTTGDAGGAVTGRSEVNARRDDIEHVLRDFVGEILQTPPMVSAIKHHGQRLYKLARAGLEVPRSAREVSIRSLVLVDVTGAELTVSVTCSKGTYVRVLAEDIGRALGCGACLTALRRQAVGGFTLAAGAVDLERLAALTLPERDALLLPTDALVASLPRFDLDSVRTERLTRGQAVEHSVALASGLARVYGPDCEFLGVAEVKEPGRIVPRRLTARA